MPGIPACRRGETEAGGLQIPGQTQGKPCLKVKKSKTKNTFTKEAEEKRQMKQILANCLV
jgi:hypothetical protein